MVRPMSAVEETTMPEGTVKWLSAQRGYAFILPDGGDAHTCAHITSVERTGLGSLNEGRRVRPQPCLGRTRWAAGRRLRFA
jgi:CspA family cold shock protein